MNLLITGGAGFIGSNFIKYWLAKNPTDKIVNLDLLTYAGNLANLTEIDRDPNYSFVKGDIGDLVLTKSLLKSNKIDVIVNFAAESHNGRAMVEPDIFFRTNVLGTQLLLEAARDVGIHRFHQISTCEVFGDLALDSTESFKETNAYNPKTPYNASKSGANHVVMAYFHTFRLPVTISHCANNYGPFQYPEKVLPRFITNALRGEKLPLFKSSQNKREWLHVEDHATALELIIKQGNVGETYNIGSGVEKSVEEIADAVISRLPNIVLEKTYVEDRAGHDRRYLLDSTKIKNALNWTPKIDFDTGLDTVVDWYVAREDWWRPLLGKGFTENYKKIA